MVSLAQVAEDLAGEFRLRPLLERILRNAVELLGCHSGSICLIDAAAGTYRKEVDLGVGCQSGQTFPLTEGATGAVFRANGLARFERYADVPGGHVRPDDERRMCSVIGAPIRLAGQVIGACVVFGDAPGRAFDDREAELLELFATHAAVAISNSRLHEEATERARVTAAANERERAIRAVHDTVGRNLASVLLHLDRAYASAGAYEPALHASLRSAAEAGRAALDHLDRAVRDPAPLHPAQGTLEEALRLELDCLSDGSGPRTQFIVTGTRRPLSTYVSTQLFRIAEEALSNAVKHAVASSIRVGLVYGDSHVSVVIEDDGCGFQVDEVAQSPRVSTMGLSGLASRVYQSGGTVHIESTVGWGTRIHARVPYMPGPKTEAGTRLRVLVVHSKALVRAGLVQLTGEAQESVRVVGEFGDAGALDEALQLLRPDVVIAGVGGEDSIEDLVATIRGVDPGIGVVLVLDGRGEDALRAAAAAGACCFVDSSVDGVSLSRAIAAAVSGETMMPQDLLVRLTGARETTDLADEVGLTAREREVCALIARGLPDKRIATILGISAKTVEKHVSAVLKKTGTTNRTMLAVQAAQLGLTSDEDPVGPDAANGLSHVGGLQAGSAGGLVGEVTAHRPQRSALGTR